MFCTIIWMEEEEQFERNRQIDRQLRGRDSEIDRQSENDSDIREREREREKEREREIGRWS